jgi:hypothetical protein
MMGISPYGPSPLYNGGTTYYERELYDALRVFSGQGMKAKMFLDYVFRGEKKNGR